MPLCENLFHSLPHAHSVMLIAAIFAKFSQWVLWKIIKIFAIRCQILRLKCNKFNFGWGPAQLQTALRDLSTLPRPLGRFKRPTTKCREGKKRKKTQACLTKAPSPLFLTYLRPSMHSCIGQVLLGQVDGKLIPIVGDVVTVGVPRAGSSSPVTSLVFHSLCVCSNIPCNVNEIVTLQQFRQRACDAKLHARICRHASAGHRNYLSRTPDFARVPLPFWNSGYAYDRSKCRLCFSKPIFDAADVTL